MKHLPCPFCGGTPAVLRGMLDEVIGGLTVAIECRTCYARSGRFSYTKKQQLAIEKAWSNWDRRVEPLSESPAASGETAPEPQVGRSET